MCGIAAIINTSSAVAQVSPVELEKMVAKLSGRGPDASGWWVSGDGNVGIANTRLSTQDARPIANQPLWSDDGSVIVTLNGEIYNHDDLRSDLASRGCRFRTRGDTEVLANGFRVYGLDVLRKIKGQYAFTAFNQRTGEVLVARDPFGICPLYYTIHDGQLVLASTVSAILAVTGIPRELDQQGAYDYFIMDSVGRERTLFKNISYLRSGFCLHFREGEPPQRKRFFLLDEGFFEPDRDRTEADWLDESRAMFFKALETCMLGDKEVGVYLSGGIDSVSVMSLLRRIFPDRIVKTFSAGFQHVLTGETVGEVAFAREMASLLRTQHDEVIVTAEDLIQDIGGFDLPPASIIDSTVARLARRAADSGVNVALSGEGADEIFFGYDHFMAAVGFLDPEFRWLNDRYYLRGEYTQGLSPEGAVLEDVFLGGGGNIDLDRRNGTVFRHSDRLIKVRELISGIRREALDASERVELDKQLIYIDYSQKVPENLLRRAEGPSMGQGVEMRFPLLWEDLIRLLYHMPMSMRISDGTTKAMFRKMLDGLIPDQAMRRPKTPFGLPAARGEHFKGAGIDFKKPAFKHLFWKHHDRVAEAVLDGAYRRENLFVGPFIQKILDAQKDESGCFFNGFLWKLWNFAGWYEHWIAT